MGGYDGQTFAGVMSTATHGTGVSYGPLASFARSIDLVAAGGVVHRIEPRGGITDAAAYRAAHPDRVLDQDDALFAAVQVGMGLLGVVYSVTIEAVAAYRLCERRVLRGWREVRAEIADPAFLDPFEHYELYLSPYGDGTDNPCMVCTRTPTDESPPWWSKRARRSLSPEILALVPKIGSILNVLAGLFPRAVPSMIRMTLKALTDDEFVGKSYRVYNIGRANHVPAYSAEIGVPVDERGLHLEAIERILEIAARHARLGDVFQTSPLALRFVGCLRRPDGDDARAAHDDDRADHAAPHAGRARAAGGLRGRAVRVRGAAALGPGQYAHAGDRAHALSGARRLARRPRPVERERRVRQRLLQARGPAEGEPAVSDAPSPTGGRDPLAMLRPHPRSFGDPIVRSWRLLAAGLVIAAVVALLVRDRGGLLALGVLLGVLAASGFALLLAMLRPVGALLVTARPLGVATLLILAAGTIDSPFVLQLVAGMVAMLVGLSLLVRPEWPQFVRALDTASKPPETPRERRNQRRWLALGTGGRGRRDRAGAAAAAGRLARGARRAGRVSVRLGGGAARGLDAAAAARLLAHDRADPGRRADGAGRGAAGDVGGAAAGDDFPVTTVWLVGLAGVGLLVAIGVDTWSWVSAQRRPTPSRCSARSSSSSP